MNLKKDHKKPLESADTVEETIDDPDHGLIAPVAEIHPEEKEKTLYHAIMEGWNLQDDANPPFPGAIYRPAVPAAWLHPEPTQPQDPTSDSTNCHPSPSREPASVSILPNLQALSEPAEQPPARLEARVHPRPKPSDISNVLAAEVRFGLRNNFFQRLATHPATPTRARQKSVPHSRGAIPPMKIARSLLVAASCLAVSILSAQIPDKARWAAEASRVTIVRDDWGIAHIHGKSDADAVFGMIYAQCEDDFNRVEMNYLTALGRTAEAEGESKIWQDLRQRLFIDPEDLEKDYKESPAWLQKLMDAWADGINFYLANHPDTKPKVLTHFEPWMALSFTEGSIGGDIERVNLAKLQAFYSKPASHIVGSLDIPTDTPDANTQAFLAERSGDTEPRGSNGIAIAPSNTTGHHALLLINPHTSFFFRSELQMRSDEGLDAYGAVTWGQFFIYQGFNERAGWMHTSSGVDAVDEFVETSTSSIPGSTYKYGDANAAIHQTRRNHPI